MNQSVLVLGCGISGIQAANLLLKNQENVILYDGNQDKDIEEIKKKLQGEASIILGELPEDIGDRIDYCIISPGIPLDLPFVGKLIQQGVDIRSEIEASFQYEQGTVLGITGTNGKTTTTALTGEIMKAYLGEDRAFTVGNIGIPYSEDVMKTSKDSVTTIELSSFQLETIRKFRPHVGAILNITPDHLNRHHTMECYSEMKWRITLNQKEEDFVVLNYEDDRLRAFGETAVSKVIWFSGLRVLEEGYYLQGDTLYAAKDGKSEALLKTNEVRLVGQCNFENILAAIAITEAYGVPRDIILETVRNFKAVPHRIEFVKEVEGVTYYNDSKGTNVDAAVQGIKAMTRPTILIGGGYDKGSEYDDWIQAFDGKVKELILIGATAEKIANCAEKYGFKNYVFEENLNTAMDRAKKDATSGDAVLLSPACASWGMFNNYEERGDLFKKIVESF